MPAIGGRALSVCAALGLVVAGTAAVPHPAAAQSETVHASTPRIIIDSDLSLWWDDATAIGMANVLAQRGQVRILGIMSDIKNPLAVAAMDAIDTAFGHPHIPLARSPTAMPILRHTATPMTWSPNFTFGPFQRRRPRSCSPVSTPAGRQPDHSVTIVAIGAYTNLAGLLRSNPDRHSSLDGRDLVRAKVKRVVIEDGLFPNGAPPVTNQKLDLAAASEVVKGTDWPTPIAWVDGFTGIQTKVGGALCTTVPATNPMRIVY